MQNDNLIFEESTHTYTENGQVLISVTQLLKKHGIGQSYDFVDPVVLEKAIRRGKAIHSQVEYILKENDYQDTEEEAQLVAEDIKKLENYEIKSELKLSSHNSIFPYAGTIDILAIEKGKKKKKKTIIYDIKTSKNWTREQEIGARWQLSLYGYALREQGVEIEKYIVYRFEKEDPIALKTIEVKPIADAEIEELLRCEKDGKTYCQTIVFSSKDLDNKAVELFKKLKQQEDLVKEIQAQTKDLKEKILQFMKDNDIYQGQSADGTIELIRVRDSVVKSIDTERLKKELPETYQKYLKETNRKGGLKINILNEKMEGMIYV